MVFSSYHLCISLHSHCFVSVDMIEYHTMVATRVQVAIRALGFEVKKADVLKILKDCDKEGKGKITFQDFNEISKLVLFNIQCQHRI